MKAIDNKELILALEELEKEKGIKKEYVLESIETALVTAYKRNFDSAENVKVVIDKITGATHIYSCKEVVEAVEDGNLQISLDEAKNIDKKVKLGETIDIDSCNVDKIICKDAIIRGSCNIGVLVHENNVKVDNNVHIEEDRVEKYSL